MANTSLNELRFEILKEAISLTQDVFQARYALLEKKKEADPTNTEEYPEIPSYDEIEELANKMAAFVSSK